MLSSSKPSRWRAAARPARALTFRACRPRRCPPMLKLLSIVTAVIGWGLVSLTLPPEILPGPIETTRALWDEIAGGRVATDVTMTLLRVVAGLLLALIMGVPVGILMGLYRRAEAVLDVW